ncbi:MAG: SUMF1/EgtB/PvdO family nonheme iron enzyme [Fuerstiella sp.]|nr:SUMF1/EgtB/PvdO family nonheme iron enzyme [Fuerstiella sp.]
MRTHRRWAIQLWLLFVMAPSAWATEPSEFTIEAHDFDSSNLRVSQRGDSYANLHPCIWNRGEYPNRADYEIDFPVEADFDLSILYTAADSRPVTILLDGRQVHVGVATVTGSWQTDHAKWEKQCTVHITRGKHTLTLRRQDCMPHICAIRMASSVPFPAGWRLTRPSLDERRAREAGRVRLQAGHAALELVNVMALRRAVEDLTGQFPEEYIQKDDAVARLDEIEQLSSELRKALDGGDETALQRLPRLQALQRELLLASPLLDFDQLLVVKRSIRSPHLGLPQNWQGNSALPRSGYDDSIARLHLRLPEADLTKLHKPEQPVFVGDVDLHFDGDRMLFSSIGTHDRWQIFEMGIDGTGLRQVTDGEYNDVDNYDACYLPDGRIIFSSTRSFASVPCVNGSTAVANLYSMTSDGAHVRQLCFDQEHNWCPTVTNDGRLLYTRWEYTDTPHTHSRLLFQMNPDGTQQASVYGSNSYWPNAMYYTRPIPGEANKVITIVSGHHGVRRMGELVVLDPAQGQHEASGVVQRIPGYGKTVEPRIDDQLVDASWPKFLHPYPLSDKYFLTACQPSASSLWGIYLVDVFDNIVLIKEQPGSALLEPIPIRRSAKPPVRPDSVDLARDDSVVFLADVYRGPGLAGIPRGAVKTLRLFTYSYDYPGMGGPQGVVGLEGPWDVRRILGTVPVEDDGSASFRVPANTPISVQPLDERGQALQVMRSWFTGMPGEVLSCVGCHEHKNAATPNLLTRATIDKPREITPWYGPARGFSFQREVQPLIDKHCVQCHQGQPLADGQMTLDLRGTQFIDDYDSRYHHGGRDAGKFSVAYANLQRFVRRPGLESDYHLLTPMEFHASTTQLVQLLEKGHHGVQLDEESRDRLVTWIDLNAPYHGSWLTIAGRERVEPLARRRRTMLKRYAHVDVDLEWTGPETREKIIPVSYKAIERTSPSPPKIAGWPLDSDRAKQRQNATESPTRHSIELGDDITLNLVLVPAGEFVMGSEGGYADESPQRRAAVDAFWMGQFEISNQQYAQFDSQHDSRHEVRHAMQFGVQGWPLNQPQQPVVRVSWHQSVAFCEWLSKRTGCEFSLPSETQWEYACRAGTATAFHFGDLESDFSAFANLADQKLRDAVSHPYQKENVPLGTPTKYDDWIPRSDRFHDGQLVSAAIGSFQPNAWGLHDMHGNVWEWTSSSPSSAADARQHVDGDDAGGNRMSEHALRMVRGGSWRDRPLRARSSMRLPYRPYQRVYNVGFRVACPATLVTQRNLFGETESK